MSVVIQTGFAPARPLTHSRICHATITRTGTLVASGEQVGFEADAALNPLTYEAWKPDLFGPDASFTTPDSAPTGVFLKPDGTKLYTIAANSDLVRQYPLSTLWDVGSAGAFEASFPVQSEETTPQELFFSSDGTKLYVVGTANATVYQYPLTTAWDISTAGAVEASFSVAGEEAAPHGLFFKPDGTKLYICGSSTDTVFQYPLSTPWDISTAGAFEASFSVTGEDAAPAQVFFKSDGTKLYIMGRVSAQVYQYPVSTPWDVSSAGAVEESFSVAGEETTPMGLFFKDDGTRLYVCGTDSDTVHQYELKTSWDIAAVGSATWRIDAGAPVSVDYVGIAAHTLGTDGAGVKPQWSDDDSAWNDVTGITFHAPTDDSPILLLFAAESHRYWRIQVTGTTTPSIGVIFIGAALAMERPIYGGHSPLDLSRQTVIRPQKSERGQFLGRSIIRSGFKADFSWQHLTPTFYRDEFDPFVEDARSLPFFLAWRPAAFPANVGYVWVPGDIQPSNMGTGKGLMQVSISVEGLGID